MKVLPENIKVEAQLHDNANVGIVWIHFYSIYFTHLILYDVNIQCIYSKLYNTHCKYEHKLSLIQNDTNILLQNTSSTLDISIKDQAILRVLNEHTSLQKLKPKSLRVQRKRILSGYEEIISINESVKSFK